MHNAGTPSPPPNEPIDESLLGELSPAEHEALRWSVRVSDGLSPESQAEFQAWLDADPTHLSAYQDIASVWAAVDEIPPSGNARLRATVAIDAAAASSIRSPASFASPATQPATEAVRVARRPLSQALVIALTVAVLGGGWTGWDWWRAQPVFSRHYATERGQALDAALPDGSSLLLDTASAADVTLYRNRREVRLPEGQVMFQIQADKSRPFDVLAGATRITVVGTKFSVRYTPSMGSQAVHVAVIEGRVRVASTSAEQVVEITAGQTIAADAQGRLGMVAQVPVDAVATWRSRRLDFDAVPLAEVLAEIERYGDIGVRLSDAAVGRLPVTASVDLRRTDAFIRTLPQVLPVRLVQGERGLEVAPLKQISERHQGRPL